MRRLLLALALLPAVAGCGWFDKDEPNEDTRNRQLYVETVEVNGRDVACVVYDSNRDAGAVDCDWGSDK